MPTIIRENCVKLSISFSQADSIQENLHIMNCYNVLLQKKTIVLFLSC